MLPMSLAVTGNRRTEAADLRRTVENRAQLVRDQLLAKSRAGDLELITFLDTVAERYPACEVTPLLATCHAPEQDIKVVQTYVDRLGSFHGQLQSYLHSSVLTQCIQLALDGVVDLQSFKVFKADWKRFRHTFMLDMHLSDPGLNDTFVLLESIGRMLLIHHEQQSTENTRKNLKLIDHLMLKHDLVGRLRQLKPVIKLMNLLGEKHNNQSLRNKLKDETTVQLSESSLPPKTMSATQPVGSTPERDTTPKGSFMRMTPMFSNVKSTAFTPSKLSAKKDIQAVLLFPSAEHAARQSSLSPVKSKADGDHQALIEDHAQKSRREQEGVLWPESMQVDASFLSDQSESSISFMDHEEGKQKTSSRKRGRKASFTPGSEKTLAKRSEARFREKSSSKGVVVDIEIREITRERLFAKLFPIIGECRSRAASYNIEARLFGKNYDDEVEYDVMYSKIIAFLDMLSFCPSLVTPLLDQQFDLEYMISKFQALTPAPGQSDKASKEKTTQTADQVASQWMDSFSRMTTLPSLDKASISDLAVAGELDSRLIGQLRADETLYLQKALLQTRQENEFLRKTMYEMRLSLLKRGETKNPFL